MGIRTSIKKALGVPTPAELLYAPQVNLVTGKRLLYFQRLMDLCENVPGDIVECGVGHGHGLVLLSLLADNSNRRLWGFDSFEGFPEPSEEDTSIRNPQKGQFNTNLKSVHKLLQNAGHNKEFVHHRVTLVQGFFNESLVKYTGDAIAFLHIDVDLYQSYLDVFNGLWDKLSPGAVIAFDEYMNTMEHHKWPGAKKAIDEFLGPRGIEVRRDDMHGCYYAIKK